MPGLSIIFNSLYSPNVAQNTFWLQLSLVAHLYCRNKVNTGHRSSTSNSEKCCPRHIGTYNRWHAQSIQTLGVSRGDNDSAYMLVGEKWPEIET